MENCGDLTDHKQGLTEEIIREEEILQREIEKEEKENEILLQRREGELSCDEQAHYEVRFKRLMHLLDRSKFYANFLLQRMQSKKEEEKMKMEKLAKKDSEKKGLNVEKEVFTSVQGNQCQNGQAPEIPDDYGVHRRGAKRQKALLGVREEAEPAGFKKKTRKQNTMEDDICNIITEEKLQQRASTEDGVGSRDNLMKEIPMKVQELPDLFEGGSMRPYQMEGFRWLVSLYENGMNGILADEMGLGKTVQCISLVAHLMDKGVTGPFLVCAPLSTLPNWISEFKKFTPRIPTVLYHGSQDKRRELQMEIAQKFKIPGLSGLKFYPVVITSFEVTIRDRSVLERFQWRYIIVDEGHRLKNYQCRLVHELKKYPSSNRLLLTGTPLQNNLSELWSLLNFLLPEIFDDLDVFTTWFRVEEFQSSETAQQLMDLERKESVLRMLHQILSPFLLRRLKTDVDLQIPSKKELLVYCPMSKLQRELYCATVDRSIACLLGLEKKEEIIEYQANGRPKRRAKREGIDYSAMGSDVVTEQLEKKSADEEDLEIDEWMKLSSDLHREPLQCKKTIKSVGTSIKLQNPMMQLKKIVNHPHLVKWEVDIETGEYVVDESLVSDCGKLAVMDQMLKRLLHDGHKVLIFSQLTMMLDVLADYLTMRGWKFSRLDGRMNLEQRNVDMESFRSDPSTSVFLISTRAGGLGVNLTAADTVIIYDSDWNPQCDLQAQDRCHRIGQTKPVVVYRLVTSDTIDQRIIDRAGAKRKLEKLVIQKGKFKSGLQSTTSGGGMTVNELIDLLKTRDHSGEYRNASGQVFTEEEMNALMDRSDIASKSCHPVDRNVLKLEGVFRRLDVLPDDMNHGNSST